MAIRVFYTISALLAFAVAQLPLYLASVDSRRSAWCDTDTWYTLGKCSLDPVVSIIGVSVTFCAILLVLIACAELVLWLLKRSQR